MRLKNVKNASQIIDKSKYVIKSPEKYKGTLQTLFKNTNPIYLEIGMGKGDFIINMAKHYPNINFIGIEMYDSVIVRAAQKLDDIQLDNLKLIKYDATYIEDIIHKEIDTIFLNFSDPWPKKRHAHRRLTSKIFLKKYDNIFKNKKTIIQKTDNCHFFEFSVKEFVAYNYKIEEIHLNLHNDDVFNIQTEYEKKFSQKGMPIYMVKVIK